LSPKEWFTVYADTCHISLLSVSAYSWLTVSTDLMSSD
jgi:hypothetical protein